jgi:hypothetical protein
MRPACLVLLNFFILIILDGAQIVNSSLRHVDLIIFVFLLVSSFHFQIFFSVRSALFWDTTQRDIPEERRSYLHRGGRLKSLIFFSESCSQTLPIDVLPAMLDAKLHTHTEQPAKL